MWKANLKKSHTPIKTPKHLWGFLFIFPPDGGEQKWEERKLQSIISTDFIDLIISDSWGGWMLFDVIWNKSTFLSPRILFFFFILLQTKRNFEQERQLYGKCMSFDVWGLYPNSRFLTYLLMILNYKLLSFSESVLTSTSLGYCYVPKHFHYGEKKNPNILTLLLPSHFPWEATPHR